MAVSPPPFDIVCLDAHIHALVGFGVVWTWIRGGDGDGGGVVERWVVVVVRDRWW